MKKRFLKFVNRKFTTTIGDAGDFTESEHLKFLLKAEEDWAEGKFNDDLIAHADAAIQLLNNQTARFSQLDDKDKDNSVTLTWIKTCGIEASDFVRADDSCAIDADEMETVSQDYAYDRLKKAGFKINVESLRTNTYTEEELVSKGLMRCDKVLSEWWTSQLMAFYKAFVGPNIPAIRGVVAPFTWDGANTTTNIPAASFNIGIVANLLRQMQLNMVANGMFINDGSLYEAWTNAMLNAGNLDGKGNDLRLKQINLEFDMWSFIAAGLTESMFLVDKNAVAMKAYNRFTPTPTYVGGKINQTRYSMKSNILPGVSWDVRYEMTCVGGKDYHSFQLETEGGIWLNPTPCPVDVGGSTYTPNGIYSFTKTA